MKQLSIPYMVSKAKKNGELIPGPCRDCGDVKQVHGHHADYSKPLDVIWLCPACHAKEHERLRGAGVKLKRPTDPKLATGKNVVMKHEDRVLLERLRLKLSAQYGVISNSFVVRLAIKQLAAIAGVK